MAASGAQPVVDLDTFINQGRGIKSPSAADRQARRSSTGTRRTASISSSPRRTEKPGLSVLDDEGQLPSRRGQHRRAARQGFDADDARMRRSHGITTPWSAQQRRLGRVVHLAQILTVRSSIWGAISRSKYSRSPGAVPTFPPMCSGSPAARAIRIASSVPCTA